MDTGGRKGRAVPKFGEWEADNNPNQAGFTVIFEKKRDEKRGTTATPAPANHNAQPSTFAPPPHVKPVSALAPPHLPKNEARCTIKTPDNATKYNQPHNVFARPDPVYNYNNTRPDLSYNNHNSRPSVHDYNQNYSAQKRRWFCCC